MGVRFTIETYFRYEFEHGRNQQGRSTAKIMGRRFRPGILYCINNCLWEIEATLDMDGFGTGNAKNSLNTATSSILQRGAVNFHAENLHPWLPTVQFGMEVQNAFGSSLARQGSGSVGAQAEYDLVSRGNGFNTGRAGQGMVLNWDDRSLSGIGIPGRIGKFQFGAAAIGEADDGLSSFKQGGKNLNTYLSLQPFSEIKNKWISGLTFEGGLWACNVDLRGANVQNGCGSSQIQDNGDGGRQNLITTGNVGKGWSMAPAFGIVYNVGPNTLRFAATQQRWQDDGGTRAQKKTRGWLVGDDLYVWSPKGFLTGSSTTPGSILFGTHFERGEIEVGCSNTPGGGNILCAQTGIGGTITQYHRNRVLLREWDLWYVIAPRMNVGVNILWYDAANIANGVGQSGYNLGLCNKVNGGNTTNCRNGDNGNWVDVFLNWRYTF